MPFLFCYGSNNPTQLGKRINREIDKNQIIKARLNGYKRHFTNSHASQKDGKGGVANVTPASSADNVLGYVVQVSYDELDIMDKFEGVAFGKYERKFVNVLIKVNGKNDPRLKIIGITDTEAQKISQQEVLDANKPMEIAMCAIAYVMTEEFLTTKSIGYVPPTDEYLQKVLDTIRSAGWKKKDGRIFELGDITLL